jgi:cardiolipin synthase
MGIKLSGPLVGPLADSFEERFARADFLQKGSVRLRRSRFRKLFAAAGEQLLLSGPGWGWSPMKDALRRDLQHAGSVKIISAYFLPTWRIRRLLSRVASRGGKVELILAGKSDVYVSQLAAQSLYRRMLKASIRIFEFQPQILHAKLIIIDDKVYVGSANLDQRSLNINYELAVRFHNPQALEQARLLFEQTLRHCREITPELWRKSRTLWGRFKRKWAYFLLVRVDPYIARRQWVSLPD